jgi:hypothetical protein
VNAFRRNFFPRIRLIKRIGRARHSVRAVSGGQRTARPTIYEMASQKIFPFVALALFAGNLFADDSHTLTAASVADQLAALKDRIAAEVTGELQRTNFNASYTTVWRAYEDAAIAALEKILPQHIPGLTEKNFDAGQTGREKNRLADFAIVCGTNVIEISIKAARRSANPENDLGTFREHPARKKLFADSFTLWVRYDDSTPQIKCDRVFFDRSWRFAGKASLVDGVKYRKKDGNMRPKPWAMFESGAAYWNTEAEFEAAMRRSELYRANELIKEHLQDLSDNDQRLLYERLKEKFETQPATNR